MKREPSLHITEKQLKKILEDIWPEESPIYSKLGDMAKDIVYRAKNISINSRSITVSNTKLDNKVKTLLTAKESDSQLLANLIYHVRRRKTKLYTTQKITKGHKDYKTLKELTKICIGFCNDFDLPKREGFLKYLEIGIPRISSSLNMLTKLVNMAETIYSEYEAVNRINNDISSRETAYIHDIYTSLIAEKTGMANNYKNKPSIYQRFIDVREITDEMDVPVDIYIKAQFHGLSWTDRYPEPNQLVGDKALERLNKYLYENKISLKRVTSEDNHKNLLLKLKQKYDNNRDNQ